jgi:threonine synthase
LSAAAVSDMETIKTIGDVYAQFGYLADPHGAVGYLALQRYLDSHPGQKGFFLETAHPVKFPGAVESATGIQVEIPASLSAIMQQEKNAQLMEPSFQQLKDYLLSK